MDDVNQFLSSVEESIGGVPVNFGAFEPTAVFPGEDVTQLVSKFGNQLTLGAGLQQSGDKVVASLAGILRFKPPQRYWVEHDDHRYQPKPDEMVIGTVIERLGESYRMNLNASTTAVLPMMAFHGATKRNHPNYEIGTLVYARVEKANKYMEPELSCMVKTGPQKDWMTGQSLFGELKGGTSFKCSLTLAESLLQPESFVLEVLGSSFAFEIAIGLNGWVWINTGSTEHTVLAMNIILQSDTMTNENILNTVKSAMKKL